MCSHPVPAPPQSWRLWVLMAWFCSFPPKHVIFPTSGFLAVLIQARACLFVYFCVLSWKYFWKYPTGETVDFCFCSFSLHLDSFQLPPHTHRGASHFPLLLPSLLGYWGEFVNFVLNGEVTPGHAVWSFCYSFLQTLQRILWRPLCPLHFGWVLPFTSLCAMFWMLHEPANKCLASFKFTVALLLPCFGFSQGEWHLSPEFTT